MTIDVDTNVDHPIAIRLASVEDRIVEAAKKSMRSREDITLLLVTKRIELDLVKAALACGESNLAENYVQASIERLTPLKLANDHLRVHFIGKLQRNKVRSAVGFFDLIHTLDSTKLLEAIERESAKKSICQEVLLQVNIAADSDKAGCSPDEAFAIAEQMQSCKSVSLKGLMTIGRFGAAIEERREEFSALRTLRDDIAQKYSIPLPHLSMGMSDDFVEAIEEGATIIRVGSAIFGVRA